MSIVPPHRSWIPGALVLAAAAVAAVLVGYLLGARSWFVYLGLGLGFLLAAGSLERLWLRRALPAPPRARGRLKVIQGGKAAPYDLAKDDSTDSQRYLM
jgi:hypothetical protein